MSNTKTTSFIKHNKKRFDLWHKFRANTCLVARAVCPILMLKKQETSSHTIVLGLGNKLPTEKPLTFMFVLLLHLWRRAHQVRKFDDGNIMNRCRKGLCLLTALKERSFECASSCDVSFEYVDSNWLTRSLVSNLLQVQRLLLIFPCKQKING